MAQYFLIRAVKNKKDDPFGFQSGDGYVYFYCKGLKDLRNTIRHITPQGWRVHRESWFSKYLRMNSYDLVLSGGFFEKREMYRIIRVDVEPTGYETFEYKNNNNKVYPLKAFASEQSVLMVSQVFN